MGAAATMASAYANGGKVAGKGTGDKVRALLDPREVVLPPDTVKAIGLTTIKALIAATHKHVKATKGRVRRMANGGLVGDDPDEERSTPQMPYGEQMANVGGALVGGVARIAKEAVSAPPDANSPGGYGLNRLSSPPTTAATAAAPSGQRTLVAGVPASDAGAGRGVLSPPVVGADARPDLAALPNLAGSAGTAVEGAPGVRKFVQAGKTLYSNVAGSDNDTLMSGRPGVQTVPASGVQPSAVAALATPAAQPANTGSSYIPGVNAPLTQYEQETAARNATVGSNFDGLSARQRATFANQSAIAKLTAEAGLQGHQIAAGASKYSADSSAITAASRLATETPEIQARTGEMAAHAKLRQGTAVAQQALLNAKTPDEREAAEENLRAVLGRDRNYPELSSTHVVPPKVNFDGSKEPGVVVTTDRRTGQVSIKQLSEQPQGAAPSANHIAALKRDPKLAAQFDQQYGKGASAQYLGAK